MDKCIKDLRLNPGKAPIILGKFFANAIVAHEVYQSFAYILYL